MGNNMRIWGVMIFTALLVFQVGVIAEAKFQQLEENGLVCMEAENYSGMRESAINTSWGFVTEPEEYSGTGAMQALPTDNTDHKDLTHAQNNAPVLEYSVNFMTPDVVYVWARASHIDGYDDSVWYGLEEGIELGIPLSYTGDEQVYSEEWYWISHLMNDNSDRATLDVADTGELIFELYMREPAFKVDKIVLTTNPDYIPDADAPEGPAETLTGGTAVATADMPQQFELLQNYPNPFNPMTHIAFTLKQPGHATVQVFNEMGQLVDTLVDEELTAGYHETRFNGGQLNSGLYFYKIQSVGYSDMGKMILMK